MLLFDLGVDLARLRRARETFMEATKAANTTRAYDSAWRLFQSWCGDAGRVSYPASGETMSLYAVAMLEDGKRLSTVRVHLAAITKRHTEAGFPSPVDNQARQVLSNAARLLRERPKRKAPVTPEQLKMILRHTRENDVTVVRDRTIIHLGFALGWRRTELMALDLADIRFSSRGMSITLGASKADQTGEGRVVAVSYGHGETCPVRQLRRWIEVRGNWQGPLFTAILKNGKITRRRLTGHHVAIILKHYLEQVGIDPSVYSAHSLRAGMATAGAENGATEISIMQRGGWKTISTVLDYVRPVTGFRADPLQGVL